MFLFLSLSLPPSTAALPDVWCHKFVFSVEFLEFALFFLERLVFLGSLTLMVPMQEVHVGACIWKYKLFTTEDATHGWKVKVFSELFPRNRRTSCFCIWSFFLQKKLEGGLIEWIFPEIGADPSSSSLKSHKNAAAGCQMLHIRFGLAFQIFWDEV